ncbi:hypothetical protein [Vibrio rumoiensis]|uniref:Type IV secretion system coupling protein TraD DNA-binding domain-containing protein n=1 Tax=Vibrio rumoiensis TaxID=76258 RepID=A0ABW7J3R5_9VIBR
MSTERLLDGTLRPTYEFYTIITTSVCMLLIWLFSQYLFLDTLEKVIVLTLGGTLVSFRVIDAVRLKRYQMSLNNIDPFFLATDEIRHSQDKTWIGRGFNWSNHHSQRVWDANKENLKKFYKLPWIYHWFRANEMAVELADGKAARTQKLEKEFINPEHQVRINPKNVKVSALSRAIAKKTKSNTWMFGHIKNPYKPIPPVGGVAAYHAVGLDEEEDQYITLDERNGHLIVFGQSRVGKTRLLEILVSQDIERNDSCVGVFDPKTDAELISEPEILVNPKYLQPYKQKVYARILLASNERRPIKLGAEDTRRWFAPAYIQHRESQEETQAFISSLLEWLDTDSSALDKVYNYLNEYNLDDFNAGFIQKTEALDLMVEMSVSAKESEVKKWLDDNKVFKVADLQSAFSNYPDLAKDYAQNYCQVKNIDLSGSRTRWWIPKSWKSKQAKEWYEAQQLLAQPQPQKIPEPLTLNGVPF